MREISGIANFPRSCRTDCLYTMLYAKRCSQLLASDKRVTCIVQTVKCDLQVGKFRNVRLQSLLYNEGAGPLRFPGDSLELLG